MLNQNILIQFRSEGVVLDMILVVIAINVFITVKSIFWRSKDYESTTQI